MAKSPAEKQRAYRDRRRDELRVRLRDCWIERDLHAYLMADAAAHKQSAAERLETILRERQQRTAAGEQK